MSAIVKICGISEPVALEAALTAGADMVGFVFFPRSPRHLSPEAARALGGRVAACARKVALTVDADDATLAAIIAALDPDLLQLHGRETPERVADVRTRFRLPVMKAVAIGHADDLARVASFEAADYLLLDAPPPAMSDRPGGNATRVDWRLLRGFVSRRPWLLAGGLDPANVASALAQTGAPGVDVSSGVETSPGRKDAGRIARFIASVRAAQDAVSLEPVAASTT